MFFFLKSLVHQKYGLLQPLPIPPLPWHSLSMDFISQLPLLNGYNAILVVIDCFWKMSLFIQTKTTCTSLESADLFVKHVFSKHGLPDNIVSDFGSLFVSLLEFSLSTLEYSTESPQPIIQSPKDRLKESTKYSKNIFEFLSAIKRMIGASGSQWQNLPTTMQLIPQLDNLLFKLYKKHADKLRLQPPSFNINQPQNFQKGSLVHSKLNQLRQSTQSFMFLS
ncbi:hypothetical protein VP01_5926g1 [Puccinia sorghi]|uniref:Integrase catalytic domain-containing protein n=1 Tax=Puccinia sorghi TaxID=27349 RepID=A0A0L6UIH7_9BASI|nr:hypothetical protein VP01_5926g1 [Puccinia sorghi]